MHEIQVIVSVLAFLFSICGFFKKYLEFRSIEDFWPAYSLQWGGEGERKPVDWFLEVCRRARGVKGDLYLALSLVHLVVLFIWLNWTEQLSSLSAWGILASIFVYGLVVASRWLKKLEDLLLAPIRPLGSPKFEAAAFREYHSVGMMLVAIGTIASGLAVFDAFG